MTPWPTNKSVFHVRGAILIRSSTFSAPSLLPLWAGSAWMAFTGPLLKAPKAWKMVQSLVKALVLTLRLVSSTRLPTFVAWISLHPIFATVILGRVSSPIREPPMYAATPPGPPIVATRPAAPDVATLVKTGGATIRTRSSAESRGLGAQNNVSEPRSRRTSSSTVPPLVTEEQIDQDVEDELE